MVQKWAFYFSAENGISLFAFHGKLNEEFDGLEAGTWARDITKPKDGRYTFVDRQTKFKIGDKLYFWTYVIYNGLGYRQEDGEYVINDFINSNINNKVNPDNSVSTCIPSLTIANGIHPCTNELIFSETFDQAVLNASKWNREVKFSSQPDYEFVLYHRSNEQIYIKDGMLNIKPTLFEDTYGVGSLYEKTLNLESS